ncbi:MAG TPA: SMP-30/gluconolactonase/LRE family protein [Kofleriaceae bacterium]|nr:SMP-30/gluconolactonase/LRE family protein [Kofleriaceae bacterium]
MRGSLPLLVFVAAACGGGGGSLPDGAPPPIDAEVLPDVYVPPPDAAPPDAQVIDVDCASIPAGPFTLTRVPDTEAIASEDLAFDGDGNLVGSNDTSIFKSPRTGMRKTFVSSLSFRAGMRFAANGDLLVNNDSNGSLVRVLPTGDKTPILTGLSYPNGMEAGLDGFIYITEHDAKRVRRVNPVTGEFTVISNNQIDNPNGITFNPDYTALYIDGFSGVGTIYKLPIDAAGNPGELVPWATGVGTGYLDGMAVDACGNLYVADYGASIIYRISPDGQTKTPIIQSEIYMPNMQWGSGIGGWELTHLYIPSGWDHDVWEVDVGVPAKPRPFP